MLRGNRSSLFFSPPLQSPRLPYPNQTPSTPHHHGSHWFNELRSPRKNPPTSHSHGRWRAALRSSPIRSGIFFGAVIFASLIVYTTFLSPQGSLWHRPQDWHGLSHDESLILDLENTPPPTTLPTPTTVETSPPLPSPNPTSDVLTVEQIRDVMAPTRGFFTRDYSLGLGWNNVSMYGVRLE